MAIRRAPYRRRMSPEDSPNQWQALCRYVEDGMLEIDNNLAERQVKQPAIDAV